METCIWEHEYLPGSGGDGIRHIQAYLRHSLGGVGSIEQHGITVVPPAYGIFERLDRQRGEQQA